MLISPETSESRWAHRCAVLGSQIAELIDQLEVAQTQVRQARALTPSQRVGRAGRPALFYAQWALRYVEALAEDDRRPIQLLADYETAAGRDVTTAQVRAYVYRSRTCGFLTKPPSGAAGGELTQEALRVLKGAAEWHAEEPSLSRTCLACDKEIGRASYVEYQRSPFLRPADLDWLDDMDGTRVFFHSACDPASLRTMLRPNQA